MIDLIKNTIIPMLLTFALGLGFGLLLRQEECEINPYDVDRDGKVTAADYVAIKNYIMEEENE